MTTEDLLATTTATTDQVIGMVRHGIWLAEQSRPGTPANLAVVAAAVDGRIDRVALRESLSAAARRHPALGVRYRVRGGEPEQHAVNDPEVALTVMDLRGVVDPDRDGTLREVLSEEALCPFDLANDAPVRARLVLLPDRTVLALTAHRIAVDETGLGVLLAELAGVTIDQLPETPPTASPSPVGTLPTDRPRASSATAIGARIPLDVPAGTCASITAFAGLSELDEQTVLLAALHALVARSGGGIHTPVGTTGPDGMSWVSEADLGDDPSFHTLAARIHRARKSARPGGELPVALVLRATPLVPHTFRGVAARAVAIPRFGIRHELRLSLEPVEDRLSGDLEYSPDLFDESTARGFADRFLLLLSTALAEPGVPLSELPVLSPADRALVLDEWNATAMPLPDDRPLHVLLAEQARASGRSPAVRCGDHVLTYAVLDDRADRLADRLRRCGAQPERLVGVCVRRSTDMVVAVLAVLKAGAAYVPLDPSYPPQRLRYLVDDSQVSVVLADAESADLVPTGPAVVRVDRETRSAEPVPESTARPDNLCYVIYTSGSTGRPKGAANQHRGVVNTMTSLAGRLRIDSADRLLQTSSLNFDMSAFDILTTLLAGGCLVIPEPGEANDPHRLLDLAHRADITVWSSTPALFKAAVDHAYETGVGLPARLRTVLLGGDRFPPSVPEALAVLAPGCRAYNFAGVTEVSFTTTAYRVLRDDGQRTSVPWGRPLPNQRMYVLDDHYRPVPPGVPGELFLGGIGVGRGYWNRPGLTAERFLPDPFSPVRGARMYRTGDRVRHLGDGRVEFLGRLDHQVKVRGFRIELGEVESVLGQHPGLRDAVADIREDPPAGSRLVAYVVPAWHNEPPTTTELRGFLEERVPAHLVPATFVLLPEIPLAPGGKIDRTALAGIGIPAGRPDLATPYTTAADELEQVIITEWQRLLRVDEIGANDEFAALGGHSLLATAAMVRLSSVLRIPLAARDLFEASTPARLARRVRQLAPERFGVPTAEAGDPPG